MDLGLKNKVAIVAAASKGLGRAVALELAAEGAHVSICSRNRDQIHKAAELIEAKTGAQVYCEPADVTKTEEIHAFVTNTARRFGDIHILVTNAGGPPAGLFADLRLQEWLDAFHLNLMSVINLCSEVIPYMKKNRWGRIINVTSLSVKQPIDGAMLSNSIRAAVVGFAKTLSNELAPYNILVNNVCPGYTSTERLQELSAGIAERKGLTKDAVISTWEKSTPIGRLGRPEEFAALVAFLASERASYITGITVPVDGGAVKGLL